MRSIGVCMFGLLVAGAPIGALAQQMPATVQLPTYSFFGVGTSVSVPDRGSAYLGGINRSSMGRNEFGAPLTPFRNRSFGVERSAANASVSVFVHDFEAMEEALLGGAALGGLQPRQPASGVSRLQPRTGFASQPATSVADIQRQRAGEQLSREQEAVGFFERGQLAEEAGKINVAMIYYRMAVRRASGDLKQQITARLDSLDPTKQAPKLAQGGP